MNLHTLLEAAVFLLILAPPAVLLLANLRKRVRQHAFFHPGVTARRPLPRVAMVSVAVWLVLLLCNKLLAARTQTIEVSLWGVQVSSAVNLLLSVLLAVLLLENGRRSWAECGIRTENIGWQAALGVSAFLAAIFPTVLVLLLSRAWRTVDTQHAYLQALRGDSGSSLLMWIALSAVIAAPLAEELLFRVILQGWLSERLSGLAAVAATAVVFALIHGWRDALPLVPLSLILGYVFHQTRSYWACVTTHALFNAANLALAVLTTQSAS